jgi:hypothetical protein
VWDIIATRTVEEQDRVAANYEDKVCRAFTPFRVGEQFYYKAEVRRSFKSLVDEKTYKMSSKLQYRYTVPHTVTEVFNPVTYKASIDGFSRIVHANRMKRDNRREISRKRIQQNRRIILKRNPSGAQHILAPATVLNPTADAALLASSIRMSTDEFQDLSMSQITAAYGVYDEEIDLQDANLEDHRSSRNRLRTHGRVARTSPIHCLCPLQPCLCPLLCHPLRYFSETYGTPGKFPSPTRPSLIIVPLSTSQQQT